MACSSRQRAETTYEKRERAGRGARGGSGDEYVDTISSMPSRKAMSCVDKVDDRF